MVAPAALWPAFLGDRAAYAPLRVKVLGPIAACLQHWHIPADRAENLCEVAFALALWIREQKQVSPLAVGISGAQGSGKSTLARLIALILSRACGFRVARLSIDDLYKTRAERRELARTVHPLLLTRGVPGTHDTELGLDVIDALRRATERQATLLPRFDKATDE
ncbi:MAG: hypothetical protein FJ189_06780, partial [Gammaproteobacteria bacterium]|nr:hypothetical protein [Gammaproteobacteria bacterium]